MAAVLKPACYPFCEVFSLMIVMLTLAFSDCYLKILSYRWRFESPSLHLLPHHWASQQSSIRTLITPTKTKTPTISVPREHRRTWPSALARLLCRTSAT